jgi:Protein of unknown function (DUF1501)
MTPLTRRAWLQHTANGFGAVALASMLPTAHAAEAKPKATAKSVIFLYMDGGPSQVDTFDHKPALTKYHGQDPAKVLGKLEPTQFANNGTILGSPWKFQQHGDSGAWVSELFPHLAKCIDKVSFIKSMTSKFSEHTSANYFLHTGAGVQGRPSWGAWTGYGLGTGNADLPTFVILNGGLIPPGGLDNFNSGFLPAAHQGSIFKSGPTPLANVVPLEKTSDRQQAKLKLMKELDSLSEQNAAMEAAIKNYETAFRMQAAVPELMDTSKETATTKEMYGLNAKYPQTVTFGTQCLITRRLVERGVKFIELTCPFIQGHDRWDQHYDLKKGHEDNARAVDQPIAALLTDLDQRGLLKDTLVVWGGEFGRTPFAQGANGRDHNPFGYTMWLAGGGVKPGVSIGETDEFGYKVVKDRAEMHDLHATMLHLLGVDHTKLTFRFGGRDMRLTDVHGEVIKGLIS